MFWDQQQQHIVSENILVTNKNQCMFKAMYKIQYIVNILSESQKRRFDKCGIRKKLGKLVLRGKQNP